MKPAGLYFPNLDGVRAFACLSVFIGHAFDYLNNRTLNSGETWLYKHFIEGAGPMGVSLFFVLSGFLITYLLIREKEARKKIHLGYFYMKRILRIWPLFFLVTIAGFFIVPLVTGGYDSQMVSTHLPWYLTFTNNFDRIFSGFTGIGNDSLGVLWSVAVEEQFYLLWPLLILLSNKRTFPFIALVIVVFSFYFRYANYTTADVLLYHSVSVSGDLAIGGLAAYLGFHSAPFRNFFAGQNKWVRGAILLFIGALVFNHHYFLEGNINSVAGRLIIAICFAWLIADQCYSGNRALAFGKIPFFTKIGVISYGFYCFHLFVISAMQKINVSLGLEQINAAIFYSEFALALVISLGISWLSYRFFESRFLRFRSRFDAMSELRES